MSEVKHTPLPWRLQPFFDPEEYPEEAGMACIIGENLGGLVAAAMPQPTEIDSGDFSRVEANARLIVQAVNSHGDLVEALRPFAAHVAAVKQAFPNDPVNSGHVCRGAVSFADFERAYTALSKVLELGEGL